MLRLVHPAPQGQEKRTFVGRRSDSLTPNPDEQKRIYAAIGNITRTFGSREALAQTMGMSVKRLYGRVTRSYGFAVLLARAAGIPVEQILSGKPHEAGTCSLCGRKGAR
jgi:hypothetical protein